MSSFNLRKQLFSNYIINNRRLDFLQILITNKVTLECENNEGTALFVSCKLVKLKTIQFLLRNGANANYKNKEGITSLICLLRNVGQFSSSSSDLYEEYLFTIELMISLSTAATINAMVINKNGNEQNKLNPPFFSATRIAIIAGNLDILRLLTELGGADLSADKELLRLAVKAENSSIVSFVL
jgi:ankyrin repeat protein